jgi:hypothetical protein
MDKTNLLKQINQEIQDFRTKQIQIVPGLAFNQYDTINRDVFYYNSRFSDVTYRNGLDAIDEDGDRMYFENINKNNRLVVSETGHPHGRDDWYEERPRITIAYDIAKAEYIRNGIKL